MYVVLFNNKILRAVKKEWIQYPFLNTISKIFYSPHKDGEANFNLPTMQVFTTQRISCYMGLICKKYGTFIHLFTIKNTSVFILIF